MDGKVSRRKFLVGAAVTALVGTAHASAPPSEAETLSEFDYGTVKLTGGPLKQQYDRIHSAYLALDSDRLLRVYRERAGLPAPGEPMGGWYGRDGFVPGHSLGQYISGLARIGRTTGDPACQAKVADLVAGFGATLGPKDQSFAAPNAENVWPCYIL
ncbi:MAG: beta-L-arabinofuranosidase domain-containing protein, partial [Terracidiphilus sp.]